MSIDHDPIWIENINILFKQNRLTHFIPNEKMHMNEKLNALVRFSIYLAVILYLYNFNYLNLYIPIVTFIITYVIYNLKNNKTEHVDSLNDYDSAETIKKEIYKKYKRKQNCRKPTKDNPFMNWLITDKVNKNACNIDTPEIKQQVDDYFNKDLYQNIGDVYQNNNSQRQYYTAPVNSGISNQEDFANWLYNIPKTCKEGNGNQCIANKPKLFLSDTQYKYRYR